VILDALCITNDKTTHALDVQKVFFLENWYICIQKEKEIFCLWDD